MLAEVGGEGEECAEGRCLAFVARELGDQVVAEEFVGEGEVVEG